MNLEDTLKSFLTELIVPIVQDAINGTLVTKEEKEETVYMTFKQIEKEYYVSRQTVDKDQGWRPGTLQQKRGGRNVQEAHACGC